MYVQTNVVILWMRVVACDVCLEALFQRISLDVAGWDDPLPLRIEQSKAMRNAFRNFSTNRAQEIATLYNPV